MAAAGLVLLTCTERERGCHTHCKLKSTCDSELVTRPLQGVEKFIRFKSGSRLSSIPPTPTPDNEQFHLNIVISRTVLFPNEAG